MPDSPAPRITIAPLPSLPDPHIFTAHAGPTSFLIQEAKRTYDQLASLRQTIIADSSCTGSSTHIQDANLSLCFGSSGPIVSAAFTTCPSPSYEFPPDLRPYRLIQFAQGRAQTVNISEFAFLRKFNSSKLSGRVESGRPRSAGPVWRHSSMGQNRRDLCLDHLEGRTKRSHQSQKCSDTHCLRGCKLARRIVLTTGTANTFSVDFGAAQSAEQTSHRS